MGGLNPNNSINSEQQEISQKVTKALFNMVSSYYTSHSSVENVVIGKSDVSTALLGMEEALTLFKAHHEDMKYTYDILQKARVVFKNNQQWQKYINKMSDKVFEIKSLTPQLIEKLECESVSESIISGNFQESMWGEEINSPIRVNSVKISDMLCSLMSLHNSFVEETQVMSSDNSLSENTA